MPQQKTLWRSGFNPCGTGTNSGMVDLVQTETSTLEILDAEQQTQPSFIRREGLRKQSQQCVDFQCVTTSVSSTLTGVVYHLTGGASPKLVTTCGCQEPLKENTFLWH